MEKEDLRQMRKEICCYRLLILYAESGLEGVFMAGVHSRGWEGKMARCREAGWDLGKIPCCVWQAKTMSGSHPVKQIFYHHVICLFIFWSFC